jgi:hypothetical protein
MSIRPFSFHKFAHHLTAILASAAVLAGGFLLNPAPGAARPDYTRRTKQECRYCHPPGGWFLNDAGKYFEKNRTLNGYKPPGEPPKQALDRKPANPDTAKPKSK